MTTEDHHRRLDPVVARTLRAGQLSRRFLVGIIIGLAIASALSLALLGFTVVRVSTIQSQNARALTAIRHETAARAAANRAGQRYAAELLISLDRQFRADLRALLAAIRSGRPIHFQPLPSAGAPPATARQSSEPNPAPSPSAHSPPPRPSPQPRPTPTPVPHPTSPPPTPVPHPIQSCLRHPLKCVTEQQGVAMTHVIERPARTIPDYAVQPHEWGDRVAPVQASGPLLYPGAHYRPMASHGGPMTGQDGLILHITAVHGDPYGFFSNVNNGASSTWWVAKDGTVEQYYDARARCWAQMSGNDTYQAAETDGIPPEPLSPQQVEALAHLYVWGHKTLGWQLQTIEHPGGHGFGWHGMGGAAWGGHYSCPDTARERQRHDVIHRAKAILAAGHPTPAPRPHPKPSPSPAPGTCHAPRFVGLLAPGSHGLPVHEWQAQMKARGWNLTVDGQFGPATETVVRAFERQIIRQGYKTAVDGEVGPVVWRAAWCAPVTG